MDSCTWDKKKYPSNVRVLESHFQAKLESSLKLFEYYQDPMIQGQAKFCIPINELNHNAQSLYHSITSGKVAPTIKPKPMTVADCLLLELLFWFKNDFFKWFNVPDCPTCDRALSNAGMVAPTLEETKWEASRVESYCCQTCNVEIRFPRYNHPLKLLETRTGRCGEWANCFTLCCCSLGFETRYVMDWTDHVWSEVYSQSQGRWLHCDPCENACDAPLTYEAGWGKKLIYVIAISKDDIQDVTWRYTNNHADVLSRRLLCRETWLLETILRIREKLQRGIGAERKKVLVGRTVTELVECMCPRKIKDDEMVGRTSGALSWRLQRGELGNSTSSDFQPYVFQPSVAELSSKLFHLKYCTAADKYLRVSSNNSELTGWMAGVWEAENIFRKTELDWKMVYLTRTEGSSVGKLSWKFDCAKTDLKIKSVTVRCPYCVYENGRVVVEIQTGNGHIAVPGDADAFTTCDFQSTLQQFILSARLSGGRGDVAWQHAQLFRQAHKDYQAYLFELIVHLE